ncbi:aldehyde dehydrogenase [Flavobacterium noncentrifugens]|uniref:Aldehyde dehydrogenase n=1 Tax=Flavobacterium noncentrifugens TaxID=1128970 RepID=A0A1G9BJB4_9FLAO|nr:aldehyde dehydrogenase [Flavobacterium noncentrifugens]GEP52473.1 aldehyde dehydrogenase [Flavobacterium noncentrifugens]SDK39537.1 aldehyde dehydrogenase (NAD+) [Flavobacterium noncentrifugens]
MNFKTDIDFRKQSLNRLLDSILLHEQEIIQALYDDFKKSEFEAVVTETGYVISDLKHTIKNIKKWTKPKRVFPSLLNFPSSDFIYSEPYGNVLVIAPWNYPFQLAMCPLIAAVAAGNSVVLKPSELTPKVSGVIAEIIRESFDPTHVEVFLGGSEVSKRLLERRWDYIFFTGSVAVGKIVAKAAAEHLTPVTLELGGKNPCIVDATANLPITAKRIVWGKFINAGQTCIAPDYILVQNKVKNKLVSLLTSEITAAYGEDPELSPDFPRIINAKNWSRLADMIDQTKVLTGGKSNPENLYLSPTLINEPDLQSAVMQEEIFGPILPIISYENEKELETIIAKYEKPLSLYIFSDDKSFARRIIRDFSFGGGCINDAVIHFANKNLPFGGVGHSGIGAYHGRSSFDLFSHQKAIVRKANWLDLPFRYAPYKDKLKAIRFFMRWM